MAYLYAALPTRHAEKKKKNLHFSIVAWSFGHSICDQTVLNTDLTFHLSLDNYK